MEITISPLEQQEFQDLLTISAVSDETKAVLQKHCCISSVKKIDWIVKCKNMPQNWQILIPWRIRNV